MGAARVRCGLLVVFNVFVERACASMHFANSLQAITLKAITFLPQAIAASHAAAAHAPKTVAAVTGDSVSNVLHDDAIPKSSAPSLFNIINASKTAPHQHAAATLKTHQPQFPPGYELAGMPPPTRQKVTVSSPLLPAAGDETATLLPLLAEGRQSIVADKKKVVVKLNS